MEGILALFAGLIGLLLVDFAAAGYGTDSRGRYELRDNTEAEI